MVLNDAKVLRDDDLLLVILSGAREGRHHDLRWKLARVLYEEEHPASKKEEGRDKSEKEPEVHRTLRDRYFIDILGMPQKSFAIAFSQLIVHNTNSLESVGMGSDYVVYSYIQRGTEEIMKETGMSRDDYDYLRGLGKKLDSVFYKSF